ncbi:transcription factor-like protein DPB isoform X2 [Physcomitrium patens]|uniref:Uncharacterized protein n=1 Tax=Physcomitrium patens TaxID=3218 RepID=A0A7I4DH11_PHYPA|nr:transcription factor-like protein DPB isoform X2 [Physcomitrium patens]|eukprot:XP_024373759.1 transcription factor-like protein DPB isoform X2 [Physcomitrella patens]
MMGNGVVAQLQHLDVPNSLGAKVVGRKKTRGGRAAGAEKGGISLRHFSMKVCGIVESKGRTTYNEVADELVAEFSNTDFPHVSSDQPQYDEKNIRRRVYDALNVLMAMGIILKDKKSIQWKGLPSSDVGNVADLKVAGLYNLVSRNEQLSQEKKAPHRVVALPFILVQTRPHATVELEISENMQVVHFDFNSTPFELHDDAYVVKTLSSQEQRTARTQ